MWWVLLSSAAFAEGDLAWSWKPQSSVSYHIETLVDTPRSRTWYAEENRFARAVKQMLILDVSCQGITEGKTVQVDCTIDEIEFKGRAVPGEEEDLQAIMTTDAARLKGKTVRLTTRADGRIRNVDVQDLPAPSGRLGLINNGLRSMVSRAFAPFDVQLPKAGADKGKAWKHKGMPLSMVLMTDQGTSGSVVMKHRVTETQAGFKRLSSSGRGMVAEGSMMEQGTSSMLTIEASGRAQFNTALGLMDWSEASSETGYAASNVSGFGGPSPGGFSGWIARIDDDGKRLEPTD